MNIVNALIFSRLCEICGREVKIFFIEFYIIAPFWLISVVTLQCEIQIKS